ncbi:hypothetical protein [Parasedimentitalea psychrophila]|uniref:Phage tail tape measure protein n=1 Tax=Parasedimentitalea psychrophila TaxID=2997337 RepID=A0A9Y2P2L5_9RHOB|nr:hypothetical protein [Parasedimentitalea psychrophila]WIY23354.1 hypothetical protein QPJ95_11825 [Parasedimentitalea psychrophila]
MSKSVIGALRVNLGLDSAKFERGAKRVKSPLASMKKHFVAVAKVAAAAGAAISAMALAGARDLDKAAKSARRLGASIGGFRALELAADEAGVSLSSLTNDIQTIDREIAAIGVSGNAQRALEALNLSVEDLSGTDADEKLAIIADRVKALGLTTGEASAVLRDLGVRNREMVLLMINGGDAIRAARQDIEDYGLAVSSVDAAQIESANDAISRLALIGKYAGQQLALELVPAMGRLARAMTESLREGGTLRGVIDGLANNLQRLMTYVAVAVTGFGARYVGALIAARVATATLSGSLLLLRGALIATGIGILIVGAGELVYQFTRLVQGAGGFGNALALLKDVAAEVWSRMGLGASSMGASLNATWDTVAGGFLSMLATLQDRWSTFLRNLAGAVKDVPGLGDVALDLHGASVAARSGSYETSQSADDHFGAADQARARADALARAAERPLSSIEALREAFRAAREETEGASDAADRFNTALGNLGEGGAGGVKKTKGAISELAKELQSVKSSAKSAFAGMVTGAKSLKDAVSDVAVSLATMFANRAFESLFGSLFPAIPGFANGTFSAPGGLAVVGERGKELVSLPRGSKVTNAQDTKAMLGGSGALDVRVYVDQDGNWQAAVEGISNRSAASAAATAMQMQDRKTTVNLQTHLNRKG